MPRHKDDQSRTSRPAKDTFQIGWREYDLAWDFFEDHRYEEAEPLFQQSYRQREKVLGSDNIDTLENKYMVARAIYKQKKYSEAETLYREVARQQERVLGSDDIDTLKSKFWLARTLFKRHMYFEAEGLLRPSVQRMERLLGSEHERTLASRYWLARTLISQEKYAEAEPMLLRFVQRQEGELGHENTKTLDDKYWLSLTLHRQGKYAEAEPVLRKFARQSEKILGSGHFQTLHVKVLLREITVLRASSAPCSSPVEAASSRLSVFFHSRDRKTAYADTEIKQISLLLSHIDVGWSKVPRMFVVLRTIGCLDLINNFIDLGVSDHWLPFTERGLPSCIRPSKRSQFIDTQQLVLTRSLDFEKGEHCYFSEREPLPFEIKGILGSGGYGQVHRVLSTISFREYALKRVSRSTVFGGRTNLVVQRRADCVKQFIAEINALKRLQHRHIVEFIGSYTDPKVIGLLMSPIADMDLSTYLAQADVARANIARSRELRTFFGCLARALEFLHGESIRHKDIKPSNILVYNGSVLFTDFGLALDFSDADGSTTVSMANGMTPKYCAPEVFNLEPRNTSSDIWSLGVVFLEMAAVLKGRTVEFVYDFLKEHGSQQGYVRTNLDGAEALIEELEVTGNRSDNAALTWVQDMLALPLLRPTAGSLIASIISADQREESNGAFCGICCASSDDDLSDYDELEMYDDE